MLVRTISLLLSRYLYVQNIIKLEMWADAQRVAALPNIALSSMPQSLADVQYCSAVQ